MFSTYTKLNHLAGLIILAIVFSLSHTLEFLYSSNQNQYFLHGLAQGGLGYLYRDWLANTIDPTPLFSALVKYTYIYFHEYLFYFYYGILSGVFLYSLTGIAGKIFPSDYYREKILLLVFSLLIIYSKAFSDFTSNLTGIDTGWILTSGIAGQYFPGSYLQPSTFGVLLVAAIGLFLHQKTSRAVVCLLIAATIHPTYLLSAAILTVSFMVATFRQDQTIKRPFFIGLSALLMALPITLYVMIMFSPTASEIYTNSQSILAQYRIPHHAIPGQWLGTIVYLKIVLVSIAIWTVRKTTLCTLLSIPFVTGLLLTIAQVITKSNFLALLFPWRVSAFLFPISVVIILANIINVLFVKFPFFLKKGRVQLVVIGGVVLVVIVGYGIGSMRNDMKLRTDRVEKPVMNHIKETGKAGDVYLIPPDTTFPVIFEDFRLYTGLPVFVDFKSIPYKDVEVIEWYTRLQMAKAFYRTLDMGILKTLVNNYKVTHIIVPADQTGFELLPSLESDYRDNCYGVYQVKTDRLKN